MKKLLAAILVFAMLFSLAGCVSVNSTTTTTSSTGVAWPEKDVELVIPAGTGGDTDTTSRVLAAELSKNLGKTFTVTNMKGGSGSIACNYMYEAKPDGYTALHWHTDMIFTSLIGGTEKTWQEAFKIVATTGGGTTTCLFVNKASGWNTMEDFVNYAKAHPGEVTVGTEVGSSNHILILQFAQALGLDLNIVQIGSGSDRATSLLAKEIDVNVSIFGTCRDYVESGDFLCLGLFAEQESEEINNAVGAKVPTIGEATGTDCVDIDFYIIAVPIETDDAIVAKFADAVKEAASSDAYKEVLGKYFFKPDIKIGQDAVDNMNYWSDYYKDAAALYLAQKN